MLKQEWGISTIIHYEFELLKESFGSFLQTVAKDIQIHSGINVGFNCKVDTSTGCFGIYANNDTVMCEHNEQLVSPKALFVRINYDMNKKYKSMIISVE